MRINSRLLVALAFAAQTLVLAGCDLLPNNDAVSASEAARERAQAKRLQAACASNATYDRLKQITFEEAIGIRNADPANLDLLAAHSVVRMENPTVKSRNDALDVTVCAGRFILELPPGAERAFAGERRLVAEIEYAAQAAADGSGLVYRIRGAEPIVYKLAQFDLKRAGSRSAAASPRPLPAERTVRTEPVSEPPSPVEPVRRAEAEPARRAEPAPTRRAEPAPARRTEPARTAVRTNPSFDCRNARTRSERMVCGDDRLAALDRAMSSQFYSELSNADGATRRELRRSRDRFLAYRERCRDESCVAQAYKDRMDEIRDIAEAR